MNLPALHLLPPGPRYYHITTTYYNPSRHRRHRKMIRTGYDSGAVLPSKRTSDLNQAGVRPTAVIVVQIRPSFLLEQQGHAGPSRAIQS